MPSTGKSFSSSYPQKWGAPLAPQLFDHHRKSLGQPLIARACPRWSIALQHSQQLAVGPLLGLLPGQSAAAEALQLFRHRGARHLQRAANRSLTEFGGHPVADDLFDFLHADPPACHASPSLRIQGDGSGGSDHAPSGNQPQISPFFPGRVALYSPTAGFLKTGSVAFLHRILHVDAFCTISRICEFLE